MTDIKILPNNFDLILCTYNEAECIAFTITEINKNLNFPNIIIVDENSPDGTAEIIDRLKLNNVNLIKRKERGLATAFMVGLSHSNSEYIGWIDSNMPSIISNYGKMINQLHDYEFVLLSRYIKGGGDKRALIRSVSSYLFNLLARMILGNKINDYTSGLFVSKKKIFENFNLENFSHGEFTIELMYNLLKTEIKILELPFVQPYEFQNNSKSFPSLYKFILLGFRYIKTILKLKFN